MTRRIVIPSRAVLEAEIEFAIAYHRACNPGRDLLGEDRRLFAEAIVWSLFERAEHGMSGMRVEPESGNGGSQAGICL